MLKLEKRSNLSGLTIRMRERDGFFEPRLLKALAIALIIHSSALFLFQVTPFYLSSTFTFPPLHVQSDQPSHGVSAFVSDDYPEDDLLPPPLTLVPVLDRFSFAQESTLMPSLSLDLHALQPLEERVWPKWQEPLSMKLEEPRIQLAISGDFADIPLLISDPLLDEKQPLSADASPAYVSYQVQLDEKTGELFW